MANKILIKHGSTVPNTSQLDQFELGYCTSDGKLYIKNGSNILNITPASHSHAWSEVTGKPAQATRWPTWSEVTSKPTVFNSNAIQVPDTRSIVSVPEDLPAKAISAEFKSNSSVGNPPVNASASYSHIINVAGWSSGEGSGGWPSQISVGASGLAVRQATSATAWGAWKDVSKPTWSDVSSKPTTATRWPTWSEVTSKPSTFAPSTHAHTGTRTTGDYTDHSTQSGSIFLGPMNTAYNHILSSLNVPYWFDRDVKVADGKQVLHAGNYTSYTSPVNLYGTSIPSSLLPGQIYVRY